MKVRIINNRNIIPRIIVVPNGGLANRMRAIVSGLLYAQMLSRPMVVVWHMNSELNAPFNLIFDDSNLPFTVIEPSNISYHLRYEVPRKKNLYLSRVIALLKRNILLNIDYTISHDSLYKMLSEHNGDVIINSGLQFHDFDHQSFSSIFKFSSEVIAAKDRILKNVKPQYALQIRRTDNLQSIANSPLELFEEILVKGIATNNSVKYFIATDDSKTKNYLSQKYSDNTIVNPRAALRNTPEGIIDAAAELYIMSQCSVIYGSYWSSFSEMAALYGNKKLVEVKNDHAVRPNIASN